MQYGANGGPAFPIAGPTDGEFTRDRSYGMTLRDYFAGQAMVGLLPIMNTTVSTGDFVEKCYRLADAMLEVRGR